LPNFKVFDNSRVPATDQNMNHIQQFGDRAEAGKLLASELVHYAGHPKLLILALPRGGVPVAFEIAQALCAPLDVFLVRKLGVPGQEELAMGAVASGNVRILQSDVLEFFGISHSALEAATLQEMKEIARRERLYRGDRRARRFETARLFWSMMAWRRVPQCAQQSQRSNSSTLNVLRSRYRSPRVTRAPNSKAK
jgi:hypothetical protein